MEYKELFYESSIDKQLVIKTDDGIATITNSELHSQQFELNETLCSEEELRFGACETSSVKFKISNIFMPLTGKWITVTITLKGKEDEPYQIGRYKVVSDVPAADRRYRDVTAYDAMYDIINADMSGWYKSSFPSSISSMTMKQFRTSFMNHLGIEQESAELANDNMIVKKTIEISSGVETNGEDSGSGISENVLSGKDIITAICEINGCFGHIGRDGKFQYIYLPQDIQGLYPSNVLYPDRNPDYLPPTIEQKLYPRDAKGTRIKSGSYIECSYEDYMVKSIDAIQIMQEENSVIAEYGEGEKKNIYSISGNFLVYRKEKAEAESIAKNVYEKIKEIIYIPFNCEAVGNPCIMVGEPVRLNTKYKIIETYVLQRTMSGIQSLRDTYVSTGLETRSKKLNSVRQEINSLKGKTNTLIRTTDETRSELKDFENDTESKFVQTADKIEAEVTRATSEENRISASISLTAEELRTEVSRAESAESSLSSSITQNAEQIALKVSKGDVSSQLSIESGQVTISGNRLVVNSTNFSLTPEGKCYIKDTLQFETDAGKTEIIAHDGKGAPYITNVRFNPETLFTLDGFEILTEKDLPDFNDLDYVYSFMGDSISGVYNSIHVVFGATTGGGTRKKYIEGSKISYSDLSDKLGGSDKRIKSKIKPLSDISGIYMRLNPVEYYFVDGLKEYSKKMQYGLIAQDTEKILLTNGIHDSGIVYKKKSSKELNEDLYTDGETYKIDYKQLHAMHIQMIQKQQKKIEELESRIDELSERLERLEFGVIGG